MVDLVSRAQVLALLEACEKQKNQLTANEFEMFSELKSRYSEANDGSFDDKICLEVMLRNIDIRNSVNMNKNEAIRVIDVEKK